MMGFVLGVGMPSNIIVIGLTVNFAIRPGQNRKTEMFLKSYVIVVERTTIARLIGRNVQAVSMQNN